MVSKFITDLSGAFNYEGGFIEFGKGIFEGKTVGEVSVKIPLKTMSRHGLIAGATGTGKTKTLQRFAESLSKNGVSTLLMDIKGDLSGITQPGIMNDKIKSRQEELKMDWQVQNLPSEILSISDQKGVRIRATVSEFGPVLFSKILDLNETQTGVVSLIFKYSDDNKLPLLNLADFKKVLQYLTNEGREAIEKEYGAISPASTSAIMRNIIALEEQGGESLFGERSFEVNDLIRNDQNGHGYINVLRLNDMQSKPKLFSTFMLCLLAEVYSTFPEIGDSEKPKLCIFIDEAHLIFENATKNLLDQLETIIKLIRSKGVGIYFITQNPVDIPASILGQLGLKIQHALRAFTANDNKAIKLASDNFPISTFYKTEEVLISMGIGEALITGLNEKGIPTPLICCKVAAPETRMDVITETEIDGIISKSNIYSKYKDEIDTNSAYEILTEKLNASAQNNEEIADNSGKNTKSENTQNTEKESKKEDPGFIESLSKNTMFRQVGRAIATEVTRGLLGVLGLKRRR